MSPVIGEETEKRWERLLELAARLVSGGPAGPGDLGSYSLRQELAEGVVDLVDTLRVRSALRRACCPSMEHAVREESAHRSGRSWFIVGMGGDPIAVCPWCQARRR